MIRVCACMCGSSDSLARRFLKENGYEDWLGIDVVKGKDKSKKMLEAIPQYPEVQELRTFLDNASKWCVIIGWNENGCRWSDIGHYNIKSRTEAQHIIDVFA